MEHAVPDMVHVAEGMWEAGADAIDFDTAGAAGDGDFLATLRAVEEIREALPRDGHRARHGDRVRAGHARSADVPRASAWRGCGRRRRWRSPRQAGATVFGPAVTVNTGRTVAWNTARAITLVKPCVERSPIPVHMNVGMGVGGIPMALYCPVDATARVSRAMVDILRLDGL